MNQGLVAQCRRLLFDGTRHPDPLVRCEAARLAGGLKDPGAVPYLVRMLQHDRWYSKITAVYALEAIGDRRGVRVLRETAKNPRVFDFPGMYNHDMIRIAAAKALAVRHDPSGIRNISDLLHIKNLEAFIHLGPAILRLPDTKQTRPLKECVNFKFLQRRSQDCPSGILARIVQALPFFKTRRSLCRIKENLRHFSPFVRAAASSSLLAYRDCPGHGRMLAGLLKNEKAPFTRLKLASLLYKRDSRPACLATIVGLLNNRDYFVRATAIDALAETGRPLLAEKVMPFLNDGHFYTRICAVETLVKLKDRTAERNVRALLHDPHPRVRLLAACYFTAISGDREYRSA